MKGFLPLLIVSVLSGVLVYWITSKTVPAANSGATPATRNPGGGFNPASTPITKRRSDGYATGSSCPRGQTCAHYG